MPWQQAVPPRSEEYYAFNDPLKWPSSKFQLQPEDISGSLHKRYNTVPIAILDEAAWHADVVELSQDSDTIEQLHKRLEERQKMRLNELTTAIRNLNIVGWNILDPEPLSLLGSALQELQLDATVYHVAKALQMMEEVWQYFTKQRSSGEEPEDNAAATPTSSDVSTSDKKNPAGSNSTAGANLAKHSATQPSCVQSPLNNASSPSTHIESSCWKGLKRKPDDADLEFHHPKRRRAATLQTKRPTRRLRSGSITLNEGSKRDGGNEINSDTPETGNPASSPCQSYTVEKATINQEPSPPPDIDQAIAAPRPETKSYPKIEEECLVAVEIVDSPGVTESAFEPLPEAMRPMDETQYLPPGINYASLGWQCDNGPPSNALHSSQQRHRKNSSKLLLEN